MHEEDFWAGSFGNDYHARNRVDWRKRIKFWSQILDLTGARSVWEWGCGPGWNLSAMQVCQAYWDETDVYRPWAPRVYGTECNESAVDQALSAGLAVENSLPYKHEVFELTCTVGALIHVNPDDVRAVMRDLIDYSCDYVLAVEYESPQLREIEYRGYKNKLWSMPYSKIYEDMGLKKVMAADAGDGFDNCTATLLRKTV